MKISVIIPYKTDRGWLQEAIASVPSNVQLIVSQGDGNWPSNFNKGLKEATGDYIKYLHDDDLIYPGALQRAAHHMENIGCDFVHGKAIEFYTNHPNKKVYTPAMKYPTFYDLVEQNVIHSVTTMYHKSVFEKIGGFNEDDKMYSFEEFEFHLRCLKAGLSIGYLDCVIGFYRRHPKQTIRTVDKELRANNRKEMLANMIHGK